MDVSVKNVTFQYIFYERLGSIQNIYDAFHPWVENNENREITK